MKMNNYPLYGLSDEAKKKLPEILDREGYKGRYKIDVLGFAINSTSQKVSKLFEMAENEAHGEPGHLITVMETSYRQVWIPGSEAKGMKAAYKKALDDATDVNKDQEPLKVACPADTPIEDGYSYRDEWDLDYVSDNQ